MAAPPAVSFAIFATAVGECAVAWTPAGICGAWLPTSHRGGLKARIGRNWRAAHEHLPPADVATTIAQMQSLLAGAPASLDAAVLDLAGVPDFHRRVYAVAREIPVGRVLTYAAVAERVGDAAAAQAVGQALGANPVPVIVPCHRVIAANGRLGGFSAPGGTAMKRRLLAIENARPDGPPGLFDAL